jgi:hypothetical protein
MQALKDQLAAKEAEVWAFGSMPKCGLRAAL